MKRLVLMVVFAHVCKRRTLTSSSLLMIFLILARGRSCCFKFLKSVSTQQDQKKVGTLICCCTWTHELTRPKKSKHWKIRTLNFIELLLLKVVHAVDVSLALALMLDLLRRLAAGAGLSLPFLGSHRWRLPPSLDNPNFKNKKSRLLLQIFVLCLSRAQRNPEFYLSDP